ncbi:hypothetical protein MIB92_10025 [Aestuariirhabdus sp. Z084]|nr:hypothetical protein [Aestuariirhabdus haliotis]
MRWLVAPILLSGAAMVMAQPGGWGGGNMGGPGMQDGRMGNFLEALDLTDEQKQKAKTYMQERRADGMAKRLGLDEKQQQQLADLMEKNQAERTALMEKYGFTDEKRQAFYKEMRTMRDAHKDAMKNILTEEQQEKMAARGGRGSKMKGGQGGKGHGMGMGGGYGMNGGCNMDNGYGPRW